MSFIIIIIIIITHIISFPIVCALEHLFTDKPTYLKQ